MKLSKIKAKKFLPFTLAGVMTLSGCSSTKKIEDVESNKEDIEIVKIEPKTEEKVVAKEETNKVDFYEMAAKTYNAYTDFYSLTGMAYEDENGNVNIQRIENFIKVMNGEVKDLTPSQVVDAKEDINYILLSQELVSNLDDVIASEYGYITLGKISMVEAPKISSFATNEETREYLEKYEMLRDKVQNELIQNSKVSEETKEELRKAVIKMEKEYLPEKTEMNTDVTAEGNKLVENLTKEALVELTILATNEARINTNEFPGGLKLAAETDEERDIQSKAMIHGLEILTDDEKEIYANMTMEIIITKYEEGVCAHLQNLADHAKFDSNIHSSTDKISYLKALKEELEEMKLNTNLDEYELTFNL